MAKLDKVNGHHLQLCVCVDYHLNLNDMSQTSMTPYQGSRKSIASFTFGTEAFNSAFTPLNSVIEGSEWQFTSIVLRPGNWFWLYHAPRHVLDMVNKVLADATKPIERGHVHIICNLHSKLNSIAFWLPTIQNESNISFGKRFLCTIFEGMYKLNYDFITSTDTCDNEKQSTIIFQKVEGTDRSKSECNILAIASKENNKLVLVRCPDAIINAVIEAIKSVWTKGIMKTTTTHSNYLTNHLPIYEIFLGGEPWNSRGEPSTLARKLWIQV